MSQDTFGMKFIDPKQATWADDKLDRKKYANQLTRLVKRMDKPFVMTLSAPWGSGKTFFLNLWRNKIAWKGEKNADEIPCVYFSAWEYDCVDDPLLAIVGKMQEELAPLLGYEVDAAEKDIAENSEKQSDNKWKNPFSKLTAVTKSIFTKENLCKIGWTVTGRILSKITADVFEEVIKDSVADGILKEEDVDKLFHKTRQAVESSPKQKLETILKEKQSFIATVKEVVAECQKKLGKKYPILIMIDELDRCRPDYVIKLLERIKNLFEADGIFFVLAIDKEQLYSVVEHTFGVKKNENGRDNRAVYLQKFINMDINLPFVPEGQSWNELIKEKIQNYIDMTNKKRDRSLFFLSEQTNVFNNDFYHLLSMYPPTSVRDFERKFEKFNLLDKIYNFDYFQSMLIWLVILNEDTIHDNLIHGITLGETYYNTDYNVVYNFFENLRLMILPQLRREEKQKTVIDFVKLRDIKSPQEICVCLLKEIQRTEEKTNTSSTEEKTNTSPTDVEEGQDAFKAYFELIKLIENALGYDFFVY